MKNRLFSLLDPSGWMLGLIGVITLLITSPMTLIAFTRATAAASLIAGLVVVGTRIFFPQIKLTTHVDNAINGNIASAIVAGSLMLFCGMTFLGVVWVMK